MNQKELIINNVKAHLVSLKLDAFKAQQCADEAYKFYLTSVGNSKDPFKETCDYAGKLAQGKQAKFKYKSPTSKNGKRTKKVQDAFDF